MSTPHQAAFGFAGDLDARVKVSTSDWTSYVPLMSRWNDMPDTANQS